MLIYCTGTLTNNGVISMTARGANAEGQDVYLCPNEIFEYEYIPKVGMSGGASRICSGWRNAVTGQTGATGTKRATGGGGSGGSQGEAEVHGTNRTSYSGAGAAGSSYSGGSGRRRSSIWKCFCWSEQRRSWWKWNSK